MKEVKGTFVNLDGQQFYRIENYDCMDDFFMTITSSSDVWNFCWSHGGITAGRIDCDHAVFPYYTADKVSDGKNTTGSLTAIAVEKNGRRIIWEPFASLTDNTPYKDRNNSLVKRNIYKNANGTKVWFEEINEELELSFRYGWTSSARFGLVKMSRLTNLTSSAIRADILDGCRNILPSSINAPLQAGSSVLLDAYKKTDLDTKTGLAMFSLSSVLTDKAEPSESLLANTAWFSLREKVILSPSALKSFHESEGNSDALKEEEVLKGERASCMIAFKKELKASGSEVWYEVFDTFLTRTKISRLQQMLKDRTAATAELEKDIEAGDSLMSRYISEADGIQNTASELSCVHHRANVMFNIMRGGFFADNGRINGKDFIKFIEQRQKSKVQAALKALGELASANSISKEDLFSRISLAKDGELTRLYFEYLPMIFSRRHGDPSRPWNRFNIHLNDEEGNPILNYEGNWRDIFQNWEALAMSYPLYIKNMCAKFLNAMTAEGFNPYRISREGIDWECPEPDNPWAQYGYWGDHQVIYFEKLLELWEKTDSASLLSTLDECIYSSSNIPYRLKSYREICRDPRSTILFDQKLSASLKQKSQTYGNDCKMILNKDESISLVSLTAKILQIVIAKAANLVPGGGIWMNTQRPEWNDANNALAGYGLSVVTLCYLNRMIAFLKEIYSRTSISSFTVPKVLNECLKELAALYGSTDIDKAVSDDEERKNFTDKAGLIFEAERNSFYKNGYRDGFTTVTKEAVLKALNAFAPLIEKSIDANKKGNGLYHTYNTMIIGEKTMKVERLQEMLEGQVAVLSASRLTSGEVLSLLDSLKKSSMFESRQYSYMLYPDRELPHFLQKNNVREEDLGCLGKFIERTGDAVLSRDAEGLLHFNAAFCNARLMEDFISKMPEEKQPAEEERSALLALYEKTFNHQSFTGRSGTFYAYEGLGSIYWHMCSKLLLAVQENCIAAFKAGDENAQALKDWYYDIRRGLSFNKTPEIYGAFPCDPYSHTPFHKGARQPGMTGQVKEEVLTRWGELGVDISGGKVSFNPVMLKDDEFIEGKKLDFTWCGTKVCYTKGTEPSIEVTFSGCGNQKISGNTLDEKLTHELFSRSGKIVRVDVTVA